MKETLDHATITLERAYSAPVERIFREFADPQVRAKWTPPSNEALVYDETDFREGGRDVFRCGPQNNLRFRGETVYHVIIPDRHIIWTETLSEGANRLAIGLNSLEFEGSAEGTILRFTVQIISFVGPGMVEGYEIGNRGALEGLSRHLSGDPGSSSASTS